MESPVPVVRFDSGTARYCVNCKWSKPASDTFRCEAPQNFTLTISLVTGEEVRTPKRIYCNAHRLNDVGDDCGASGRWFEPRVMVEGDYEHARAVHRRLIRIEDAAE